MEIIEYLISMKVFVYLTCTNYLLSLLLLGRLTSIRCSTVKCYLVTRTVYWPRLKLLISCRSYGTWRSPGKDSVTRVNTGPVARFTCDCSLSTVCSWVSYDSQNKHQYFLNQLIVIMDGWLVVYLTTLFSVRILASMTVWWIRKDLVGSGRGLILSTYPDIRLEELRKNEKTLSRDLNPRPSE
jgi:hypothetical protein